MLRRSKGSQESLYNNYEKPTVSYTNMYKNDNKSDNKLINIKIK